MNRTALVVFCLGVGAAVFVACSSDDSSTSSGGKSGPTPTAVDVTWTLAGEPASAASCEAHGGTQVYVNLGGTVDTTMHQTTTVDCSLGSVKFDKLTVEGLGAPYLDVILLDKEGKTVDIQGAEIAPVATSTPVAIDFFAPTTTVSTTDATTGPSTTATTGGTGGMGGAGGMGAGGAGGTGPTGAGGAGPTGAGGATSGAGGTGGV